MKKYNVIRLKFLSPLHLGEGKENYDFSAAELHSDTLTAALAAIKAEQGADAESLSHFLSSFRLSSAFPFYGQTYYLPRLAGRMEIEGGEEEKLRKQLKKIRYIASDLWIQSAAKGAISVRESWIHGAYLLPDNNKSTTFVEPFVNQVNQRVSVPRDYQTDPQPFYFEWRFFQPQAGLYCITDANGPLFEELCSLFSALGESGLGTDKNIGGGHFTIETDTLMLPEIKDANAMVLLSLYLPQEDELGHLDLSSSRYSLILRGGYMAGSTVQSIRHLWKKSVYMFTEGSIFPTLHPLEGTIADLQPEWNQLDMHPVYRSGRAFTLPIKQRFV